MTNSVQVHFNIIASDHEFFGGDSEPTITVETSQHKFYIQTTNGVYDASKGCLMFSEDGEVNWDDYEEIYGADSDEVLSTIIKLAEIKARHVLKCNALEKKLENDAGVVVTDQ